MGDANRVSCCTPRGSAAFRAGAVVAVVHAGVAEFGLAHDAIAGMSGMHMGEIAPVVGNAEHCTGNGSCAREHRKEVVDHLVESRPGRYRSNSSKMRRYSSAHEEGLTNA